MDESADADALEVTDEELVSGGASLVFCSVLEDSPNPKLGIEETSPRLGMEETSPTLSMEERSPRLGMEETSPRLGIAEAPRLGMEVAPCVEALTFSSMGFF